MMECLFGKGVPSCKNNGNARAAANDMTPRVPVHATTNTFFHVLSGSSLANNSVCSFFLSAKKFLPISACKYPDDTNYDRHKADQ